MDGARFAEKKQRSGVQPHGFGGNLCQRGQKRSGVMDGCAELSDKV